MRAHGRVRVDARWPQAAGICDRCGLIYQHNKLAWQHDWRSERLLNLRILVCARCYDTPQEQLRARILSPDPVPIMNARPEPFTTTGFGYDESNIMHQPRPSGLPFGSATVGFHMNMPDGKTSMLMVDNAPGINP